jgi:hypothetical protein
MGVNAALLVHIHGFTLLFHFNRSGVPVMAWLHQ